MKSRALSTLKREAARAARFRGHVLRWARTYHGSRGSVAVGACRCGAEAIAETCPWPNGVDVGGTAVAIECPENATLRDRRGRPTPQGFACGHVEAREDGRGRVTLWREHGCYHVAATPNGPGPVRSMSGGTLSESRKVAARFWRDLLQGLDSGTLSKDAQEVQS